MTVILSTTQSHAIAAIRDWYRTRRHSQQIFRLFGFAGTGKTTITELAMEALGLEPMTPGGLGGVIFAAFTGKACYVMTRKGTPAQTIHSLIYRASEATPEEIERVTTDLAALRRGARLGERQRHRRLDPLCVDRSHRTPSLPLAAGEVACYKRPLIPDSRAAAVPDRFATRSAMIRLQEPP